MEEKEDKMNKTFTVNDNTEDEEIIGVDKITKEDKAVNWQPKSR